MTTISSPSELFPAPPEVSLDLPQGWEPTTAPGALLSARKPGADRDFMSNVLVRVEHREDDFTVDRAVEEIRATAAGRAQGETAGVFRGEIDGCVFDGIDLSWVDDRAGTLLQVHLFHTLEPVVPGGAVNLLQLVGTCGGSAAATDYPVIKTIIRSARVVPWKARSGVRA
ncbi:hypothetical protein [Lapillicoccus sp.]|uniref:hypothetical protein n=1 Tax=Lapillicoccus sp. TaxID=1909287 RepID=UPI0025F2067D|nr:hypothetical protein [Lapillicoccus sp.]